METILILALILYIIEELLILFFVPFFYHYGIPILKYHSRESEVSTWKSNISDESKLVSKQRKNGLYFRKKIIEYLLHRRYFLV